MRIFISYGHDEYISFARQLAKAFKERSYEVWFDENYLKGGVLWEEYIEKGLKWVAQDENGRMILVMTPHSVRRPDGFCLNELAYALDLHLPVLPIMLVWTTPPLSIYRYQWIDLTRSARTATTFETDFEKIIEAIETEHYYEDDNRNNIERLLEPLDYSVDINLYIPSFVGRQWIFEEFEQWLHNKEGNRIFLLTGLPGIGKTAIAVKLIETYINVAAYHLIRRGDSEKTSLRRAICTISYQLSKQLPDYYEQLLRVNISRELSRCNDLALFNALIATPLSSCTERPEPVLIVIDALDESIIGAVSAFAEFVANVANKLPQWIRFVLTSRPEEAIVLPLQAYQPYVIDSKNENNTNDILLYIKKRIKENYGDITTINCREIADKSEGIFLYAKYVCDELLPDNIKDYVASNLPAGIGAVYFDFFSRNYPELKSYRQTVKPILEVIAAQVEPFTPEMLADCLKIDTDEIEDFLADFHILFTLDARRKLHPFHSSLIDWITNKGNSGRYAVKRKNGEEIIAEWLYKKFKASGWNFFNDSTIGLMLETWLPEILTRTNNILFNSQEVLSKYMEQVHGKSILHDLVSNRHRFHFIKSVLTYMFQQPDFSQEVFEEVTHRNKNDINTEWHVEGIKYLYKYSQCGISDLPPQKPGQPDYYYYLDVQLPMFYVQSSFDPNYIFKVLAYGLMAVVNDGRISNIHYILSDIYMLATTSFSDNATIAVKYLMEVSHEIERQDEWSKEWGEKIKRCANSIMAKYK